MAYCTIRVVNTRILLRAPSRHTPNSNHLSFRTDHNNHRGQPRPWIPSSKTCRRLGASKLIFAVRSISAGEDAKQKLLKDNSSKFIGIEVWPIDIMSYASVKA